jgi:RNA polymerase sigma factor (sigma-70 family)
MVGWHTIAPLTLIEKCQEPVRFDGLIRGVGNGEAHSSSSLRNFAYAIRVAALNDPARHHWVAIHILPHEREVRGWLRRHVRTLNASDIDDLLQEAYTRLWTAEYSHITNGRSYLFAVIRNLLLEQARHARIVPMERLGEIDALLIPSDEPGPDRKVSARQELERLERIVAALPDQCRRAFQLQKFQNLSQREIAHEMNIAEKTVEKHLAGALVRVLDALKEDDDNAIHWLRPRIGRYDAEQSKD